MYRAKQWLALLIVFSIVLSACSGGADSGETREEDPVAMGRYMERETGFPEFGEVVALERKSSGVFYVLGSADSPASSCQVWCSEDGGDSWEQRDYPGLEDKTIISGGFTDEGGLYLTWWGDISDPVNPEILAGYANENGFQDLTEEMPELATFNAGVSVTDSGEIVMNNWSSMTKVDPATGRKTEFELTMAQAWQGTYGINQDTFVVSSYSDIYLLNLETGEERGRLELANSSESPPVIATDEGDGYYYCNSTGLYHISGDGAITEQLIDGELATFSLPSVNLHGLFSCEDESFLILMYNNGAFRLVRYVFDETVQRVPSRELSVYSLRESPYVRQIAGLYQSGRPDTAVRLTIGLEEGSALTADDAIRSLSTELLAGKGPDVLVLDGLPVEPYIEKGALAELEGLLGNSLEGLLPQVTAVFTRETGVYAVPARISLPVIGGVGVEDLRTAADMAEFLQGQEEQRIGVTAETVMEKFLPLLSYRWFEQDGALNPSRLEEDLIALERILRMGEAAPHNQPSPTTHNSAIRWSTQGLSLIAVTAASMEEFAHLHSAIDARGEGAFKLLPDNDSAVFLPGTILGITASGSQMDAAADFVTYALGEQAQSNTFSDGLPVNEQALEGAAYGREPGTLMYIISNSNSETGEYYELATHWLDEEASESVLELVRGAVTPSCLDEVVRQILLTETAMLFEKGRPVEDTVKQLEEKIGRYHSEQ